MRCQGMAWEVVHRCSLKAKVCQSSWSRFKVAAKVAIPKQDPVPLLSSVPREPQVGPRWCYHVSSCIHAALCRKSPKGHRLPDQGCWLFPNSLATQMKKPQRHVAGVCPNIPDTACCLEAVAGYVALPLPEWRWGWDFPLHIAIVPSPGPWHPPTVSALPGKQLGGQNIVFFPLSIF